MLRSMACTADINKNVLSLSQRSDDFARVARWPQVHLTLDELRLSAFFQLLSTKQLQLAVVSFLAEFIPHNHVLKSY